MSTFCLYLLKKMIEYAGIEAQLAWLLLFSNEDGSLRESSVVDYAGMLEGMEATELLALVRAAQRRLVKMGVQNEADAQAPVELYIDKSFCIRMGGPAGTQIPFRPLVRAVFILFLKHPEGILLKDRARFQKDLEDIYKVIAPEVDAEEQQRISQAYSAFAAARALGRCFYRSIELYPYEQKWPYLMISCCDSGPV